MPEHWNSTADAIVAVFNRIGNADDLDVYLKARFKRDQYIYMPDEELAGREFYEYLREKLDNLELMPVAGNRLVICHYMKLQDLTEEWIDRFFNKAEELKTFVFTANNFDQHYIIALQYEAGGISSEEEKERINRLLVKLGTDQSSVSRQVYLVWKQGFNDYMSQEKALVELLHLYSARDYAIFRPVGTNPWLRMLNSADYYTEGARDFSRRIEEIDAWEDQPNDPGLAGMITKIKATTDDAKRKLNQERREFQARASIYPVSIANYGGIFRRKIKVPRNKAIMDEVERESISDTQISLARQVDFSAALQYMKNEYHFPDYKELEAELNTKKLKELVFHEEEKTEHVKKLNDMLYTKLEQLLRYSIPDLEKERIQKAKERNICRREQDLAGRYTDVKDCLHHISEDTNPQPIKWMTATTRTLVLVNGAAVTRWDLDPEYYVPDVPVTYITPEISPCEVFVLKESNWVRLDSDSALEDLNFFY